MSRDESKLLFAESHEWVEIAEQDEDRIATIGISAFALTQLNDLVYMELPTVGNNVAIGDEIGEVESVKAVSPLYSPVAGQVVEVHEDLPDQLEQLNSDPYDFGWILKIKVDGEVPDSLMDYAKISKAVC